MKFLIIGLGNVGNDYKQTRHNIGFEVVEKLAAEATAAWELDKLAWRAEISHRGRTLILLKPTTYMNLSGQTLRYWLQKEGLELAQTMTILDDLNLDLGRIRIRAKGSAGGHNGLKNIEELLQTNEYPRIRLGIGDKFRQGQQVDFVLGKFSPQERPLVDLVVNEAANAVKDFSFIGLEQMMNVYNSKNLADL